MTELSPATREVLNVFTEDDGCIHDRKHLYHEIDALADALRVVAKQVMPELQRPGTWHQHLMKIAEELENFYQIEIIGNDEEDLACK